MNRKENLILASASPRRKELLSKLTEDFSIKVCEDEERSDENAPYLRVMDLAEHKAEAVGKVISAPSLVIGSDTIVVLNGEILGKPKDPEDAVRMLKLLSGNTHEVYTGVCLYHSETGKYTSFYEMTKVTMISLSDEEIQHYVETGEPLDKAGAYGIQGISAAYISGIQGDYYTVVGLPICSLRKHLLEEGFTLV